jgi:hypothetical protein
MSGGKSLRERLAFQRWFLLGSPAQFAARDSRSVRRTCRKYLEFFMSVECFAKVRGLKREEIGVLSEDKKRWNQAELNWNVKSYLTVTSIQNCVTYLWAHEQIVFVQDLLLSKKSQLRDSVFRISGRIWSCFGIGFGSGSFIDPDPSFCINLSEDLCKEFEEKEKNFCGRLKMKHGENS